MILLIYLVQVSYDMFLLFYSGKKEQTSKTHEQNVVAEVGMRVFHIGVYFEN